MKDKIFCNVLLKVRDQTYHQVDDQVWIQVDVRVWNQVWIQVWVRNKVYDMVSWQVYL